MRWRRRRFQRARKKARKILAPFKRQIEALRRQLEMGVTLLRLPPNLVIHRGAIDNSDPRPVEERIIAFKRELEEHLPPGAILTFVGPDLLRRKI